MADTKSRYKRAVTAAAREKADVARATKLAGLHDTLTAGVQALTSGDQWRKWLDTAAKFHSYSFRNTVLLLAQNPDAQRVAGYGLWQELGRQVTKGEKGLMILAPVTRRVQAKEDEQTQAPTGTDTEAGTRPDTQTSTKTQQAKRQIFGYTPAYVWDVTQTTGQDLPERPRPQLLTGQAPDGLWDSLAAQVTAAGFSLTIGPAGDGDRLINGYTDYTTRTVVVREGMDAAQQAKTLAHELGHVLMHEPGEHPDTSRNCRGVQEVEAESFAYILSASQGMDTSSYTFLYVAGWAHAAGDVAEVVTGTGKKVLAAAHTAIDTIETAASPLGDVEANGHARLLDDLGARVNDGATRTGDLLAAVHATQPVTLQAEQARLAGINAQAADFFTTGFPGSWAESYLEERVGVSPAVAGFRPGYAPAGWTGLTTHLREQGVADDDILAAGLGMRSSRGNIIDCHRDRLMFPIHNDTGQIAGFIGRRNPATPAAGPKYFNTASTALYSKGDQLFGHHPGRDALAAGALPVLVEGPLDAIAVTVATEGRAVGLAPLGTALTDRQTQTLTPYIGDGKPGVTVATDHDPAGSAAAEKAYWQLTAAGDTPRIAALPAGLDPAGLLQQHGASAVLNAIIEARPLAEQLIDHRVAQHEDRLGSVDGLLDAVRASAEVIGVLPAQQWPTGVEYIADKTGALATTVQMAVIVAGAADREPLGRLTGRDRRDDLDRGQYVAQTAAGIAAMTAGPRTVISAATAHSHTGRDDPARQPMVGQVHQRR
jgi:DNA primase catalytic core